MTMEIESISDVINNSRRNRIVDLAALMLKLSPVKRCLMRAPLRVMYKIRENRGIRNNSHYLKDDLQTLERVGIIYRHPGYVEIVDREALLFVSRLERGSSLSPEP